MANYWYPLEGTAGTAVTATNGTGTGTPFTDIIGTPAPQYVTGGFGGIGTAMVGTQTTGDVWVRRAFASGTTTFLASCIFYLPETPPTTTITQAFLMRSYGGTNAGPSVMLANPGNTTPKLQAQTRGSGSFVTLGDVYTFNASERGYWYRVEMWANAGGGSATGGAMRVRLYRASGSDDEGWLLSDITYTNINASQNATWQDVRFGAYPIHRVDDLIAMENVASSSVEAWSFDKTANRVWDDPSVLGSPSTAFTRTYVATTVGTNAVGTKTWTAPVTVGGASLVVPPNNTPTAISGAVSGSTVTIPAGAAPAGSKVTVGALIMQDGPSDTWVMFPTDVISYPLPGEGTVIAAASNPGGATLFPPASDHDITTGVDLALPQTMVLELQPLSPRSPLNVQVDLCCAVGGSASVTATVNGKSASSQVTGSGNVALVVPDVPQTGLDWRKIPVTIVLTGS